MAAIEIESNQAPYLRSLLDPKSGPANIPDDQLIQCKTRSEPITTNVTVGQNSGGQGLFVFYPNNPTGLVGHHYSYNTTTNTYAYDATTGAIRTAQSLRDNYNFGRLVSQVVEVRSSTLPAGVYALNGTFNAVTVNSALSELTSAGLSYNSILQSTTEILDKVGNVLVGDGLSILTLPYSFDLPFARFNDLSPASYSSGGTSTFGGSVIASDNNTQMTTLAGRWSSLPAGASVPLFTQNVDSTNQIEISGQVTIFSNPGVNSTSNLQVEILDAFGAVINTNSVLCRLGPLTATAIHSFPFSYVAPSSFYTTSSQPIAAVRFSLQSNTFPAGTDMSINGRISAINAAYPGVNYPLTVVAYQGAAAGTQITISGVANYELLPNALLKRNVDVSYAPYRKKEMAYVKAVMAMRSRLEIRSVMPIQEYRSKLALYHELSALDQHNLAMAFDWGDLIRGLKNIASPILSTFFPLASPLIGAAGNAIDSAVDYFSSEPSAYGNQRGEPRDYAKSMSGNAIGRSMSGLPIGALSMSGTPIGRSMSGRAIGHSSGKMGTSNRHVGPGSPLVYKAMASDSRYEKHSQESQVLAKAKDDEDTGGSFSCVLKKENRRKGKKVEAVLNYKPVAAEEEPATACDDNTEVALAMDTVTPIAFLSGNAEQGLIGGTELDVGYDGVTPRGVLFPVVIERDGLGLKTASYLAVPGDFRSKLPAESRDIFCESQTGRRIYGHTGDLTHIKLMSDMTVLPVAEIRGGRKCLIMSYAPPVAGTSCVAALICADKGKFSGVKAMLVTGNVKLNRNGRLALIPNPASVIKTEYSRAIGLPLAEGSIQKYCFIQNILSILEIADPCDKALSQVNLENQVQAVRDLAMSSDVALAADDEFFPPPPPPLEESYDELMEEWKYTTTKLCDLDQDFSKLIDIVNWLTTNGLIETTHKFIKKPSSAKVFPVLISNITPGAAVYKRDGAQDTPGQAQWKRFSRLAENLRTQYPDITPEWVEMNSGRGPSQEQARYFSYHRILPAPGTIPEAVVTGLRDKVLAAYPMATANQRQQLADYIDTHGVGPDQETMRAIFSKRADPAKLEAYIGKVANDNRLDETEISMLRDRVMSRNRGLTQEELAEVLYDGGARVRPHRAPAPSRMVQGGSGAPIFNRVDQLPARNSRLARFIGASEQGNVGSEIV